jgi:hypothetical protein
MNATFLLDTWGAPLINPRVLSTGFESLGADRAAPPEERPTKATVAITVARIARRSVGTVQVCSCLATQVKYGNEAQHKHPAEGATLTEPEVARRARRSSCALLSAAMAAEEP